MSITLGLKLLGMIKNNAVEYSEQLPIGIVTFMPIGAEHVYNCISKNTKDITTKTIFKDFVILLEIVTNRKYDDLRALYIKYFNENITKDDILRKKEIFRKHNIQQDGLLIKIKK